MRTTNYIITALAAVMLLAGCEKKSYVAAFDELPQERVAKQIDSVKTILTGAENGWIGVLSTGTGGGFGFFMEFDAQENVNMVADLTNASATTMKASRYRVRQDAGVALSFDTYNYISMLISPDPTIYGGIVREGFRSDVDFIYDHATADSIIFVGKRYRQLFKLVKATADQKSKYTSGVFATDVTALKNFFSLNSNNYIEIDGVKVLMLAATDSTLSTGKRLTFIGVGNDGVTSVTRKFGYAIGNMNFADNDVKYWGKSLNRVGWKGANSLAAYDDAGTEYLVRQSPQPFIDFTNVYAYNLFYNSIFAPTGSLPPGVVSDFNAIYSALVARFASSGRVIRDFEVKLNNSSTLAIRMNYYASATPASVFLAEALSTYTFQDGIIRLTGSLSINGNWNTRATQIGDFGTFFQGKSFKPDWVSSSVPGLNIGGLYRVDQPTAFVYGLMRRS